METCEVCNIEYKNQVKNLNFEIKQLERTIKNQELFIQRQLKIQNDEIYFFNRWVQI